MVVLVVTVDGRTARLPGAVGRTPVRLELSPAPIGGHDVRVRLVADGRPIDDVTVMIPNVNFTAGAADSSNCA